jgi:predicted AAA+ superfamily ATPase
MDERLQEILARAERLLEQFASQLPSPPEPVDWSAIAYRWQRTNGNGSLHPIIHPHTLALDDLQGIDRQKGILVRNTHQFIRGLPANNALLWGSRGTGKSSLIKALLQRFSNEGLRLIEVDRNELVDLPEIVALLRDRPERFILFCDDLSFEAGDPGYKALKVALDGSLEAAPENVLIYASSNRHHLVPEYMSENQEAKVVNTELHLGDTTEEKISLSERFGLWLSFYPFNQDEYLGIVRYWLLQLGIESFGEEVRGEALRWAQARGTRSGRSAWQFARDWAGRLQLNNEPEHRE